MKLQFSLILSTHKLVTLTPSSFNLSRVLASYLYREGPSAPPPLYSVRAPSSIWPCVSSGTHRYTDFTEVPRIDTCGSERYQCTLIRMYSWYTGMAVDFVCTRERRRFVGTNVFAACTNGKRRARGVVQRVPATPHHTTHHTGDPLYSENCFAVPHSRTARCSARIYLYPIWLAH